MAHSHGQDVQDELMPLARDLRRAIPAVYAGFAAHSKGAARAGATKEEVAEAIGVTFLMAGGPATVYGPRAYAAFCEYADGKYAKSN